jgi:hypothetical protein
VRSQSRLTQYQEGGERQKPVELICGLSDSERLYFYAAIIEIIVFFSIFICASYTDVQGRLSAKKQKDIMVLLSKLI